MNYDVDLLERLVAIDTNSVESKNYEQMAALLKGELKEAGAKVEVLRADAKDGRPRPNVIGHIDNGAEETLGLNAHFDTVQTDPRGWKTDPFRLEVHGDKAFGRGTADDKSAIVAALSALKKAESKVNLEIMFTCDEEIGGEYGVGWLVSKMRHKIRSGRVVVLDGRRRIVVGACGRAPGKITVTGAETHSAYPFLGKNAITSSLPFLSKIQKFEDVAAKYVSKFDNGERKIYGRFNLTVLRSGVQDNVIPGRLEALFDLRNIPEVPMNVMAQKFRQYFERVAKECKVDAELEFSYIQNGFITNPKEKLVRKFSEAADDSELYGAFGGDDGRFFHKAGIPVLDYGAQNESMHKDNEYVSIKEMNRARDTLARLLEIF